MILSQYNLKKIAVAGLAIPSEDIFELPEKVLQFGTGVLLRGLTDYVIDKANREGVFNGRIVVVKSTNSGSIDDFERQDGLYTLYIKGMENGQEINEQIISSSISRVLSVNNHWETILKAAYNPYLKIIVSNTTEAGITQVRDDITRHPPTSFPGKLLAFLYERYKAFDGSDKSGFVIIPTELIVDNGRKLESIILELAHLNKLEPAFMDWLENCNHFCNSLVDRIVPGKPSQAVNIELEKQSGYTDDLRTISEAYLLWAIEGSGEVRSVLSFARAHPGVIIEPNIEMYRELKLRLLNGTHTLSCAIAFLSGFKDVKEAMNNSAFTRFLSNLMLHEITPAIPYQINAETTTQFTHNVLDRFRNPNIEHQWLSISAQYSAKIRSRILPLLLNHYKKNHNQPGGFVFGFAAFIRFMKVTKTGGKFIGHNNGEDYPVTDINAERFYKAWLNPDIKTVVESVLKSNTLWGTDLTKLPGFKDAVTVKLEAIMENGTLKMLEDFNTKSL